MSLCKFFSGCCICLNRNSNNLFHLTSSSGLNTQNTRIWKLRKCVSEIDWSEDYLMCQICTQHLDAAYDFYSLCLQSRESLHKLLSGSISPDTGGFEARDPECKSETNESYVEKPSEESHIETSKSTSIADLFCDICHLKFSTALEFEEHNEKVHADHLSSDGALGDSLSNDNDDSDSGLESNIAKVAGDASLKTLKLRNKRVNYADSASNDEDSNHESGSMKENAANKKPRAKRKKRSNDFICELCENSFNASTKLIQHAVSEHNVDKKDVKPFACSKCPMRFTRSWGLTKHSKSHDRIVKEVTGDHKFTCDLCQAHFKKSKELVDHCVTKHEVSKKDAKPFSCVECTKKFPNSWRLKEHLKVHNKVENTNGNITNDSMKANVIESSSDNAKMKKKSSFICEICGQNFIYCTELVKHSVEEHKMDRKDVKPFICNQCPKRFDKNTLLIQHMKFHEGIRNAICPYCGKGFITKGELHIHEKTHLNRREYQCTLCPKRFNTSGDRNRHKLVVHTDPNLWKYVCHICSKRLPSKSHYDTHMRRHNNDKPFACHLCEKRFCDKIVLQKHLRSHTNVKPYKCSECKKEYKDERTMLLHMARIHKTGNIKVPERVKKYVCVLCPKSYYDKGKLTKHFYSHTGERPFACSVCSKRFTDKSYVKHHMKTVHNLVAENTESSQ